VAELSLAAQAILDAYGDFEAANTDAMAAALRAAVDQVVPEVWFESDDITEARDALLAIAAELEGINPTKEGD
jgi:phosphoglucomutase